ncbi:MAG: dienelactone hydrolase family protein [Planctomycetota bacterium]
MIQRTALTSLLILLAALSAFAQGLEELAPTPTARHYRLTEDASSDTARFDLDLPKTQTPTGGFPTVVIVPGLGCQAEDYSIVRKRLVDEGYAVATFEWKDNEDYDASDWDARLEVMTDLLLAEDQAAQSALRGRIDEDRLGILGHSLGGSVAVVAAARDRRFKALAVFGPGGRETDFLDHADRLRLPVIAIDGSLDKVTPPDEASGVVLERANTRYTAHVIIADGSHPNCPADFNADYIRDSGRFVWKAIPFWPFYTYAYEFPIIEGVTPLPGRTQRAIAFPYLVGWFDRFVAGDANALDVVARGEDELAQGKLTRASFSAAVKGTVGVTGGLGGQ